MAEPFKNMVSPESVARLAEAFLAGDRAAAEAFTRTATDGLDQRELKARVAHVARALRPHLPAHFPQALALLVAGLPPRDPNLLGNSWLWPVLQIVEDEGAAYPVESLAALEAMTSRFSAEFAVRPIVDQHPEVAWPTFLRWTQSPDEHVRRLASEGSRPRLPWGMRLRPAVADPEPGLAVISRLVDDPSAYVRRSVANHLGDVAKDHPGRALEVADAWLAERPDRMALVRHGLRSVLKMGHPDALLLMGNSTAPVHVSDITVIPNPARMGDFFTVSARLLGTGLVRVDVIWQWPGARGGWSSRTFVGRERELNLDHPWVFAQRLSLRPVTTRPIRAGTQRVWLLIAGQKFGPVEFSLLGREGDIP